MTFYICLEASEEGDLWFFLDRSIIDTVPGGKMISDALIELWRSFEYSFIIFKLILKI